MICKNKSCKKEIPNNTITCPYCGIDYTEATPEQKKIVITVRTNQDAFGAGSSAYSLDKYYSDGTIETEIYNDEGKLINTYDTGKWK